MSLACPLGYVCKLMGLNARGMCDNAAVCIQVEAGDDEEFRLDELCGDNPYLRWTHYWKPCERWGKSEFDRVVGWFWAVMGSSDLPNGYAVAESVQLPFRTEADGIVVTQDDEHYQIAERNLNYFMELVQGGKSSLAVIN